MTVKNTFRILSFATSQPCSRTDKTSAQGHQYCKYPHYELIDLTHFDINQFKYDHLPAIQGNQPIDADLRDFGSESFDRLKDHIIGCECLVIDWDDGKDGSNKAVEEYLRARGISFVRINSRSHGLKKDEHGIADRSHFYLVTSRLLPVDERTQYQYKLDNLLQRDLSDWMQSDSCVDHHFAKNPAQFIYGFVRGITPGHEVYTGNINIDTYLDSLNDPTLDVLPAPQKTKKPASAKTSITPQVRQEASQQPASQPAQIVTPAVSTPDADYSTETLIKALNQIDPRVFNTRSDSSLFDKLSAELGDFRESTAVYLSFISGCVSAGIPFHVVDEWCRRDADYDTSGDNSSRLSNCQAYSGQDRRKFYKIYKAYTRAFQIEDILTPAQQHLDQLDIWMQRGFNPSFNPYDKNGKKVKTKLTTSDIESLLDAMSRDPHTELYLDMSTAERVCRSSSFKFSNEREMQAVIFYTLFEQLGYKEVPDRVINHAITKFFSSHRDNTVSRFLAKQGISADKWDGVSRIDGLFTDILGLNTDEVQTPEFLRASSRYLMTAMLESAHYSVIEGRAPKVEILPIFYSAVGGVGKNTLISALCFDEETAGEFHTTLDPCDFNTKSVRDVYIDCGGCILAELGDVPFSKVDIVRKLKYKLSEQSVKFSVKFEMFNQKQIRHFMYIATTNDNNFLNTTFGGVERRFDVINFDHDVIDAINTKLKPVMTQIWCEAMHIYETEGLQYKELDTILKTGVIAKAHSITEEEEEAIGLIIDRKESEQVTADANIREIHISTAELHDELCQSAETRKITKAVIRKVLTDRGYSANKTPQKIRYFELSVPNGTLKTTGQKRVYSRKVRREELHSIRARAEAFKPSSNYIFTTMTGGQNEIR